MGWRDLVQAAEDLTVPWTGGRTLRSGGRTFQVKGALPEEHGFHVFTVDGGRRATWKGPSPMTADGYFGDDAALVRGWLIGDRVAPDDVTVVPELARLFEQTERVWLLEPGLERYARIVAARDDDRWIYVRQDFPLGPEDAVRAAWLDRAPSLDAVPGVPPALDLAFRLETWQREEVARQRAALEQQRLAEERRKLLVGETGHARRQLARQDFEGAARAALRVGGAELLDHRRSHTRGEYVIQFRYRRQTFECVCDEGLRIVDSGICLVDHATGERGDTRFTLESLPAVVGQAMDEGRLVRFRHVGEED